MKLKIKDSKYFSELGGWKSLATAIFAAVLLKMVQLDFFSLLVGTIIFSTTTGVIIYFSDKREWFSTLGLKIGTVLKKIFHFYIQNWVPVTFTILTLFTIYWFGIRPVAIRKDCSVVRWTEPATLTEPASANWPECEKNDSNPLPTSISPKNPQECYGPTAGIPAKTTPLITDSNGVVTMSQTSPAIPATPASANWPECQSRGNPFDTENLMRASSQPQNCYPSKPASPERNMERKAHDTEYKTCLRDNGI